MYQLTESELDTLHTAGNMKTLDIALFSLSAGILAALVVTLLTVDLKALNEQASFVASTWVFGLATIFFGVRASLHRVVGFRGLTTLPLSREK